jgi:hypothetical protein
LALLELQDLCELRCWVVFQPTYFTLQTLVMANVYHIVQKYTNSNSKFKKKTASMNLEIGMDSLGSKPRSSNKFISSPKRPDRLRGQPSPLFSGYPGSSPVIKRPGPSCAEVKERSYTSTPPICLYGCRHGEVFSFFLVCKLVQ